MNDHLPSIWQRVAHQLRAEVRRDFWLLLFWWAVLALHALESWDLKDGYAGDYMPAFLPIVIGMAMIWRLVRTDHPSSSDSAALTRPIGRGALWLAKAAVIILLGLLPWTLSYGVRWHGYGLSWTQWFGIGIILLLPALTVAGGMAWLASLSLNKYLLVALSLVAGLFVLGPFLATTAPSFSDFVFSASLKPWEKVSESIFAPNDLNRCRSVIALAVTALGLWAAWWRATMGDHARSMFAITCGTVLLIAGVYQFWTWNWRRLPNREYVGPPLKLNLDTSDGAPLWPGLQLTGLPKDCVASVMAFAPVRADEKQWPQRTAFSDFTAIDDSKTMFTPWRWMTVSYARHLSGFFPPDAIWIGDNDDDRKGLREIIAAENRRKAIPEGAQWRLRLAVIALKRGAELPLRTLIAQRTQLNPYPGYQLDFVHGALDQAGLRITSFIRQRMPLVVPNTPFARLRPMGFVPTMNLIFTVQSPKLNEVVFLHEGLNQWRYLDTFWQSEHHRPIDFTIPLPKIHQAFEGLNIQEWVDDSRFSVWWPEERGTIDLTLSAEQMKRLMTLQKPAKK